MELFGDELYFRSSSMLLYEIDAYRIWERNTSFFFYVVKLLTPICDYIYEGTPVLMQKKTNVK